MPLEIISGKMLCANYDWVRLFTGEKYEMNLIDGLNTVQILFKDVVDKASS